MTHKQMLHLSHLSSLMNFRESREMKPSPFREICDPLRATGSHPRDTTLPSHSTALSIIDCPPKERKSSTVLNYKPAHRRSAPTVKSHSLTHPPVVPQTTVVKNTTAVPFPNQNLCAKPYTIWHTKAFV